MNVATLPGGHAVDLLGKLLRSADRRKPDASAATAAVDYGAVGRSAADLDAFQAILQGAERAGAVRLVNGRHSQSHQVVRVRLSDPDRLASFLGRERAGTVAADLEAAIRASLPPGADPWVGELLDRCAARWRRGESAWKAEPGDRAHCMERFAILGALAAGLHRGDQRSFSASLFRDRDSDGSKVFERHRGQVIAMLREVVPSDGSDDELLAGLGVVRFPPPVELSGPVEVDLAAAGRPGAILPCDLPPFATVRSEWLGGLRWSGAPVRALLTIENRTSFERHVREVAQPDACVVYVGGMPSAPVLRALRTLLGARPDLETFHWGDFDVGGLRILANLREELGVEIRPHLMDAETVAAKGRSVRAAVPPALRASPGCVGEMAARLHATNVMLEQERVDPGPLP
jgi:hypothetical protein